MRLLITTLLCCSFFAAPAQHKPAASPVKTATAKPASPTQERLVEILTTYGPLTVKLYDSTPLHRDNFIKLVQSGFYDSLLFHRIINGFMIQGGDPTSRYADSTQTVGDGAAPGERIPAEFKPYYIHKKGALAMARDNNPAKASSNCQFYLVQGKVLSDVEVNTMECRVRGNNPAYTYTDAQRNTYKTIGGTPFLDQNYTIFGEVVTGLNIIDSIAKQPRDARDRPIQPVRMQVRMLN